MKRMMKASLLAVLAVCVLTPLAHALSITSLSATDAPLQGQVVTITASVLANTPVQQTSNIYYEIIAPDGVTVVQTHRTTVPILRHGDTFSDAWSTNNSSFPQTGNYTVTACWSRQNQSGCNIDYKVTTFYSVPTVGIVLGLVGLGLFGAFMWKRKDWFTGSKTTEGTHVA